MPWSQGEVRWSPASEGNIGIELNQCFCFGDVVHHWCAWFSAGTALCGFGFCGLFVDVWLRKWSISRTGACVYHSASGLGHRAIVWLLKKDELHCVSREQKPVWNKSLCGVGACCGEWRAAPKSLSPAGSLLNKREITGTAAHNDLSSRMDVFRQRLNLSWTFLCFCLCSGSLWVLLLYSQCDHWNPILNALCPFSLQPLQTDPANIISFPVLKWLPTISSGNFSFLKHVKSLFALCSLLTNAACLFPSASFHSVFLVHAAYFRHWRLTFNPNQPAQSEGSWVIRPVGHRPRPTFFPQVASSPGPSLILGWKKDESKFPWSCYGLLRLPQFIWTF